MDNNKETMEKENVKKSILLIVLIVIAVLFFYQTLFPSDGIDTFDISLSVGDTYDISDEDGIIWSSSNNEIASISEDGVVTAIAIGTVTIKGEKEGIVLHEYTITIKKNKDENNENKEINNIDFAMDNISLLVGETYKVELNIEPSNYNDNLTWKSSDNSVANIKDGIITAIGKGSTNIIVTTSNGLSSICKVTVNENNSLKSISFSDNNKSIYIGEKYQTEIIYEPVNPNKKVTYKSTNNNIATIDDAGLITGKGEGEVVIIANIDDLSAIINIKVSKSADKTINVKFDNNGSTSIGSSSAKCTSQSNGCIIKLPSITRKGYNIVGWSSNANATSAEYKVGDKITVYGDTTYYAITNKTLKADFKSNGASMSDATETCKVYNKKDSCNIRIPNIIRTGYNIIGWGTDASATSSSVSPNSNINLKSNVEYFAITSKILTANFVSNGANISDTKKECVIYNTNSSCEIVSPSISRSGYNIVGWGSSSMATTKVLDSESTVKLDKTVTYYAVTYKRVTTSFVSNRSNISKTSATCDIYNNATSCNVTSPTITRNNYSVLGWAGSPDASTAIAKSGENIAVSSPSTYYALTKINVDGIEAGCTGWMAASSYYYNSASDISTKKSISVGTPITIEEVTGDYFKVTIQGVSGYKYIMHKYAMINLADYIPSMVFEITNASSSIYRTSGYSIPNVTGTKLYASGKVYNVRLRKNEYIAPMLYSAAKKLLISQKNLLAKGYSIKVYDVYRPHSVSVKIYNEFSDLCDSNSTIKNNILYSYGASGKRYEWNKSWFLSSSVSSHNTGSAIDMTLVYKSNGKEVTMPTVMHELSTKAIKYYSPNVSSSTSNYSKEMNDAAKLMDNIVTSTGLTPLASEWWHFYDSNANKLIKSIEGNGCDFSVTRVYSY